MLVRQLFEAKENKLEATKLPYNLGDLSPVLSKDNVDYHYNVLTKGYVNRYNKNEGDSKFNYGGAKLHNLWWSQLQKPKSSNNPVGNIKELIEDKHENFKIFKDSIIEKAMSIQGSGWVYMSKTGEIKTTPNQSFSDYTPAKDAKKRYLQNVFKIVNWQVINNRLDGNES